MAKEAQFAVEMAELMDGPSPDGLEMTDLYFAAGVPLAYSMASTTPILMMVGALSLAVPAVWAEETSLQKVFPGGIPVYDPAVSKAPAPPRVSPAKRRGSQSAQRSLPNPARASSEMTTVRKEAPVVLPRFMVRSTGPLPESKPAKPLPSMVIRSTVRDEPAEQFETAAARDARLVRNHLSEFDRYFLNRVTPLGISKEQRAREAEAIHHSAQEMDSIAELIQADGPGKADAEEARKLREAYFDTYVARPK